MERILSMIGLAKKAGLVEIGEEPVGSAARAKHARVILVAGDAAASSVRRAYSFAQSGSCLCLTVDATKDQLGSALGRTSVAMVAVTDVGLAAAVAHKPAAVVSPLMRFPLIKIQPAPKKPMPLTTCAPIRPMSPPYVPCIVLLMTMIAVAPKHTRMCVRMPAS